MGKWTPNYTDNVLNVKLSALITGAINRAAVEKEPTITFEDFVKELDTGDAFTTSLVDILVKELAERHTRPYQNGERRLIAPRTVERLNSLVHARSVYRGDRPRGRNHFGRRTLNLSEIMSFPANDMDIAGEDEDDFGSFMDGAVGAAEGARFNTDLFEAYGSHPWSPFPRRMGNSPSPPLEDEPPTWRIQNSDRTSPWAAAPSSSNAPATSLTRHPSIRRPTRSRFLDFNDWTSRRRSTIRDAIGNQNTAVDGPSSLSLGNDGDSGLTVRRFFGTRRLARRPQIPSEERDWGEEERSYPLGISVNHQWASTQAALQAASSTSDSLPDTTEGEDRPLPRLRRGGVRPPEVLLTQRYPGPAPRRGSGATDQATRATSTIVSPSPTSVDSVHPMSPGREDVIFASADPAGYPTPSSIDTEPSST